LELPTITATLTTIWVILITRRLFWAFGEALGMQRKSRGRVLKAIRKN
jgi:hypothetical protein